MQILFRLIVLVAFGAVALLGLPGCGQTGPLYLPSEPEAAQRATLPEILTPGLPAPRPQPVSPTASPSRP
ncbi:MAG: LPS translocon maturation chaperone LptM [Hylemonella sp.]